MAFVGLMVDHCVWAILDSIKEPQVILVILVVVSPEVGRASPLTLPNFKENSHSAKVVPFLAIQSTILFRTHMNALNDVLLPATNVQGSHSSLETQVSITTFPTVT
jgi:hypothetical protein